MNCSNSDDSNENMEFYRSIKVNRGLTVCAIC